MVDAVLYWDRGIPLLDEQRVCTMTLSFLRDVTISSPGQYPLQDTRETPS